MTPSADSTATLMERVLYEVKRVVVGQDRFLERVLIALLAQGHGGWLAVTSGEYWSRRAHLEVLEVRRLGAPATAFAKAAEAFQQRRHARLAEIA